MFTGISIVLYCRMLPDHSRKPEYSFGKLRTHDACHGSNPLWHGGKGERKKRKEKKANIYLSPFVFAPQMKMQAFSLEAWCKI